MRKWELITKRGGKNSFISGKHFSGEQNTVPFFFQIILNFLPQTMASRMEVSCTCWFQARIVVIFSRVIIMNAFICSTCLIRDFCWSGEKSYFCPPGSSSLSNVVTARETLARRINGKSFSLPPSTTTHTHIHFYRFGYSSASRILIIKSHRIKDN